MQHLKNRFESKIEKVTESGCWLWSGYLNRYGYGLIKINGKGVLSHRISYELYKGDIPVGLCVCHTCDVRSCVNPDHLFIGTRKDNNKDRDAKGRYIPPRVRGEKNGKAKLTNKQVIEIRASQESNRKLAKKYNIGKSAISDIKTNKTWRHI